MRWLLVHPGPNFSVADVYNGWAEALRGLGEHVVEYNLDDRLNFYDACLLETGNVDDGGHVEIRKALDYKQAIDLAAAGLLSACYQVWPDVILATSAFFTPPWVMEVLRARPHKLVLLFTEGPYQTGMQLKMAEYADLSLVNDPCDIDAYRAVGPAEYMPHAYRPGIHHPGPAEPDYVCDLGFSGTGYPSRAQFFEEMDLDGLDVFLAGNWTILKAKDYVGKDGGPFAGGGREDSPLRKFVAHDLGECFDNEQTATLYRSARTGINVYRRESEDDRAGEGWAVGPREIEMAASGLWFARDPRPESDELFPMLPAFSSPQEASQVIRWGLAHPDERAEAARKAREAIADRTFDNHARKLLAMLDQ